MNLLLDTHVLLWWLDDDPTLSRPARAAIADRANLVFVSSGFACDLSGVPWRVAGKLELTNPRKVLGDAQPPAPHPPAPGRTSELSFEKIENGRLRPIPSEAELTGRPRSGTGSGATTWRRASPTLPSPQETGYQTVGTGYCRMSGSGVSRVKPCARA